MNRDLKLLTILFLFVSILGCDTNIENPEPIEKEITPTTTFSYFTFNKNSFFLESYDLVVRTLGSSKMDTIKVPAASGATPIYQWVNSKLLYKTLNSIVQYDPQTMESSVLIEWPTVIFGFHANKDFIAYSHSEGFFLYDFASETVIDIERSEMGDIRFPVISPDGQNVLFAERGSLAIDENTGFSIAYPKYSIYDIETNQTSDIVMPEELAFLNYRLSWICGTENMLYSKPSYLLLVNPRSKESRRLTNEETLATRHNVSPDGTKVSYIQSDQSQNGDNWQGYLTVIDLSDFSQEVLFEEKTYETAWNPSSDKLLYSYPSGVSLFDFETAKTQEIETLSDTNLVILDIQWVK